jgi:hypothetical protein
LAPDTWVKAFLHISWKILEFEIADFVHGGIIEYLREFEAIFVKALKLTLESVVQMGLFDEKKTRGKKSRDNAP